MEDLKAAFLDDPSPIIIHQQESAFSKAANSTTIAEVAFEAPQVQEEISDIDAFLSDSDSLKSLVIEDGPPVIKPRPYQKEMLEESLRRNIIVAVSGWEGLVQWMLIFPIDGYWVGKDAYVSVPFLEGVKLEKLPILQAPFSRSSRQQSHCLLGLIANFSSKCCDAYATRTRTCSFGPGQKTSSSRTLRPCAVLYWHFQILWFLAPTVALCEQQHNYISAQIAQVHTRFLSGADNVDAWGDKAMWDAILKNVRIVVSTYQILLNALDHGFVWMQSLALVVFDEGNPDTKSRSSSND